MCGVMSRTITREEQAVAVISTAIREYFWYGKAFFEEKRELLAKIVDENHLQIFVNDSTFPTWKQLYDEFWRNSERIAKRVVNKRK